MECAPTPPPSARFASLASHQHTKNEMSSHQGRCETTIVKGVVKAGLVVGS